jgi:hypothetical protein
LARELGLTAELILPGFLASPEYFALLGRKP